MTNTPSVGRVVHYVSYGTPGGEYGRECRAAIVTEVNPQRTITTGADITVTDAPPVMVGLCVLNPTGQFFNRGVAYDGGEECSETECGGVHYEGGTWHWPERDHYEQLRRRFNEAVLPEKYLRAIRDYREDTDGEG